MNKIVSLLYHPRGRIGLVIGMTVGLLVGLAGPLYQILGSKEGAMLTLEPEAHISEAVGTEAELEVVV